jgi:type II secretory pathway pseudopilin PulG
MLVATFGPSTAWQGREIIWDVDHFILVGHGAIPAAGVLDYDRRGQLVWADPAFRAWVNTVDSWEHGGESTVMGAGFTRPAGAAPGSSQAGAPPARNNRIPGWVFVVGAVAAGALIIALILVALVPSMLMHTVQTMSRDSDVSTGVRTLQTGIETYATEHNGRFPDPGEVNPIDLSRYITTWPENPYSHLPMADGGGEGNFRYDLSSDGGAYKIIGYGRGGKIVIELSGGTPDTV